MRPSRIMMAAVLAALVALGTGCGAMQAPPVAPLADTGPHPADELAAARVLPDDTLALVNVRDFWTLLDLLGMQELIAGMRGDYERLVYELVDETGFDLLDRDGLSELGIAGDDVTVALLSDPVDQVALVLPLFDTNRFKRALYRWGSGQLGGRSPGPPRVVDGSVVVGDDSIAVLLRDDLAVLLLGYGASDTAAQLARSTADDRLARRRSFRVAMKRAGSARVRGWFDVRGIVYQQAGMDPRWGGVTLADARRRLERRHAEALANARSRAAGVDELVQIDGGFRQARRSLDDEDDERSAMLRRVVGNVEGAALALQVWNDRVEAAVDVELSQGGWLHKLLRGGRTLPSIAETVEGSPWLVAQLAIDPAELVSLAELFGESAEGWSKGFGVNVNEQLVPLLRGELAAAVWSSDGAASALADSKALSLATTLAVSDDKAFMALLPALDESELVGGFIAQKGAAWQLEVPGIAPLAITTKDGQVRSSNARGWPQRGGQLLRESRAGQILGRSSALSLYLDVGKTLLRALVGPRFIGSAPMVFERDPDVPISDAYRSKLAELEALRAKIDSATREAWLARAKAREARVSVLGGVAASLSCGERRALLDIRYATDGTSMREAVKALVTLREELREREPPLELPSTLEERQTRLEAEIEEIYLKDVDAFMRDKSKQPAPEGAPDKPKPDKPRKVEGKAPKKP